MEGNDHSNLSEDLSDRSEGVELAEREKELERSFDTAVMIFFSSFELN